MIGSILEIVDRFVENPDGSLARSMRKVSV